jgi:hypothetical protein
MDSSQVLPELAATASVACDDFSLDLNSKFFNTCTCGHTRDRHNSSTTHQHAEAGAGSGRAATKHATNPSGNVEHIRRRFDSSSSGSSPLLEGVRTGRIARSESSEAPHASNLSKTSCVSPGSYNPGGDVSPRSDGCDKENETRRAQPAAVKDGQGGTKQQQFNSDGSPVKFRGSWMPTIRDPTPQAFLPSSVGGVGTGTKTQSRTRNDSITRNDGKGAGAGELVSVETDGHQHEVGKDTKPAVALDESLQSDPRDLSLAFGDEDAQPTTTVNQNVSDGDATQIDPTSEAAPFAEAQAPPTPNELPLVDFEAIKVLDADTASSATEDPSSTRLSVEPIDEQAHPEGPDVHETLGCDDATPVSGDTSVVSPALALAVPSAAPSFDPSSPGQDEFQSGGLCSPTTSTTAGVISMADDRRTSLSSCASRRSQLPAATELDLPRYMRCKFDAAFVGVWSMLLHV